jgi:hypothetical protein
LQWIYLSYTITRLWQNNIWATRRYKKWTLKTFIYNGMINWVKYQLQILIEWISLYTNDMHNMKLYHTSIYERTNTDNYEQNEGPYKKRLGCKLYNSREYEVFFILFIHVLKKFNVQVLRRWKTREKEGDDSVSHGLSQFSTLFLDHRWLTLLLFFQTICDNSICMGLGSLSIN